MVTPIRSAVAPQDALPTSPLIAAVYGEPQFHTDADVCAVAFSADGKVWSVEDTGVLKLWTADGKLLKRNFLSDLETLWVFGPNAELLASGNDDLLLWDTAEGQLLGRIVQPSWVTAIAFSPDGNTVVSGHDDGSVRFWDARTQRLIGDIPAHPKAVSALAFSPNGERLASAGEDRVVRLWDAMTHKPLGELCSHTDRIPALAWNGDGTLLVSAGWDTSARVWQPGSSEDPLILLNSHADQVLAAVYSPDGKLLATADSEHEIHLWSNAAAAKVRFVLRGHLDEVKTIAFNRDGSRIASAGVDRVIHVWDTATGQLVAGPNTTGKHGLAFVPSATPLLASTGGPQLRVWAAATRDEVAPTGTVVAHSVAADPKGRWLAVGGGDATTRLYDLSKPDQAPRLLDATKPPIGALAFGPTGKMLVQASPTDGLVWLWETESTSADPTLILIEAADGCTLESVAVHPNGTWVAVGGVDVLSTGERDGAVCIWDATTKLKVMTFDFGVTALAFDPNGKYLAGAGLEDKVYLWDLAKEEEAFALDGHAESISCVAFSPDGNYLLSGAIDQTVRVWDVLSGRLLIVREFDSPVQTLAFSADGATLYAAHSNTTVSEIPFAKFLND